MSTQQWLAIVLGYLLGSIPFGYLLVKFIFTPGVDIREVGSGNIGATNVARAAGKGAGFLTYLLDFGKGMAAIFIASALTGGQARWMGAAGVAALLGHNYPVWLRFRGGKGVATGLGVFMSLAPYAMISALMLWAVFVWTWRYVSLASILATATVPVWIWFWDRLIFSKPVSEFRDLEVCAILACALVVGKHHTNIRRLLAGTEDRIDSSTRAGEA